MAEQKVGFIGLGIMGEGMVRNLAKGGVPLVVWNRTKSKCEELKKEYPTVEFASTPAEVVKACTYTFSMLSNLEASSACFEGDDGVLAGVTAGKAIVDCATLTPEAMISMHSRVTEKGGKFLEAPVSGTKKPAADGQLIFLTGGDEEVLKGVEAMLGMMGKATHFLGAIGNGTRMKLVVNMVMGSMMGAVSEGAALAEGMNLKLETLFEVLSQGAMACPMFAVKSKNIVARDYPPAFPLKHAQKDMAFALGEAGDLELPVATAANNLFLKACPEHQDEDFSAVGEALRKGK